MPVYHSYEAKYAISSWQSKLIEYAKLNPTVGTRKIGVIFQCGRTQVQPILKPKESIISDFDANAPAPRKRSRNAQYQDIDGAVYKWLGNN